MFDFDEIPGAYEAHRITRTERASGIERAPRHSRAPGGRLVSANKLVVFALVGVTSLLPFVAPVAASEATFATVRPASIDPTVPVELPDARTIRRFDALRDEWLNDFSAQSGGVPDTSHCAYRAIIAMGWEVVPLLLREMDQLSGHWQEALAEITGEDPLRESDFGDLELIARRWVEWGERRTATSKSVLRHHGSPTTDR